MTPHVCFPVHDEPPRSAGDDLEGDGLVEGDPAPVGQEEGRKSALEKLGRD